MTKILLVGLCPLPFENTRQSFGPGIRTWQMASSLARAGHEVDLLAMRIPGTYDRGEGARDEIRDGIRIRRLKAEAFLDPKAVSGWLDSVRPDAVVGATVYGSHVLATAEPEMPFWADQFGHVMAEAQAKAHLEAENWPLAHFWNLLAPVLHRADRMSVVSERQRYAAIGELGLAGRLTSETCGYDFISVIPCALVPPGDVPIRPLLRGEAYPEDAFVVLWSGGYNVWSDVDTLFDGLVMAMEEEPRLHFVSTGGEIGGHDETTYRRFEQRIAGSPFRERFHLQGWVRAELVPSFVAEADLGVLSEIPIYEGLLGSKNRVVQWMGLGLPVAYNAVGDLGQLLEEEGLGLVFPPGDSEELARRLTWSARHPDELAAMAGRARAHTEEHLSFAATTRDLVAWAEDPTLAPDAVHRGAVSSPADFAPAPVSVLESRGPAPGSVEPRAAPVRVVATRPEIDDTRTEISPGLWSRLRQRFS